MNIDAQAIENYKKQGFTIDEIERALKNSKNINHFENLLYSMKQNNDDQLLQQAIAASLLNNKLQDPQTIQRTDSMPCGLKNVGNTCYFNSLLQTYFFNYEFVSVILKWRNPNIQVNDKRIEISYQLLQHLQALFVRMIGSDRKYVDPSIVLKSICDDFGNALPIGDQKDVGEFNHYFLSRIDEGLQANKASQSMIIEQQGTSQIMQHSQIMTQQQSMLRRQSSIISENSIVQKLFFGKITSEIFANDIQIKQNPIPDMFNFIQIDVNFKTLPEALERYMNQPIDYKTENNYVPAIKQLWITQAPEVLSFQIQRVQFNKDLNSASKINSFFHFDNELTIDRYLFNNSKLAKQIQQNNVQLKERMKKIEMELQSFTQFNGNVDIIKNLETTLQFLKIQNQTESKNPYYIDSNDNKAAIQQVTSYLQALTKRRDCLKKEMEECQQKVAASYNNLNKHKYVLQSILMHEGSPDAGHYYAYIYNFEQKKWYCFNDTNVTIEDQEQVLINAYGDQHYSKSAYLLTYIKEEASKKGLNSMIPLRSFRISTIKEKNQYLSDGYGQLLSHQQRDLLINENNYFKQELEEIKQQQASEKIVEKYQFNIDRATEKATYHQQWQQINAKFKLTPLCGLGVYVKYRQNETLFRWLAFDSAVKQFTQQGVFDEPLISSNFKQSLLSQITSNLGVYKSPSSPQPPLQDVVKIKEEYFALVRYTTMALFITEQYANNNFFTTMQSLQQYTKAVKLLDQKSFFYEFAIFLKYQIIIGILAKMIKAQVVQESDIVALKLLIAYQMQEHFQYKDPKFWKEQILNLIDVIGGYNQLKKAQFQEITKPAYENKKNAETFQQLDKPCEGLQIMISNMIMTYSEADFQGVEEDLLIENLQFRIQALENTKVTKILFDKISNSQTILDPQQVQQIILDYQQ